MDTEGCSVGTIELQAERPGWHGAAACITGAWGLQAGRRVHRVEQRARVVTSAFLQQPLQLVLHLARLLAAARRRIRRRRGRRCRVGGAQT